MSKFLPLFFGLLVLSADPARCAFDSVLWSDRVASTDENVRKAALKDLQTLSDPEKKQAVRILGSVLHRGPVQAERAAWGLAQLGTAALPALNDLVYALSYDEESVAVAVSSAVVPLGGAAVDTLRHSLDDANFFTRRRVAEILGKIGPAAGPASGALIERLGDPQYEVQTAAEAALIHIGAPALPELMRSYNRGDESVRRHDVQLMAQLGPGAAAYLIDIAKKDTSGYVRLSAMDALSQLHPFPKEALPTLMNGLYDMDEGVRGGAADALGSLGPLARPALRPLKHMSEQDTDTLVRQKASDALAAISVSTETLKK